MESLLIGLGLGLIGGFAPGPLLPLLVSNALQKGFRAGVRIAVSPLFSDPPIMFGVLVILIYLPDEALKWLGVAGGVFISGIGIRMFRRAGRPQTRAEDDSSRVEMFDLGKGIMTNFLSVSAWIFWLVIAGPFFVQAWHRGVGSALGFLLGYFSPVVGVRIGIAWMVARKRKNIGGGWTGRLVKICAVGLLIAGGVLSWQAIEGNFERLVRRQQREQQKMQPPAPSLAPEVWPQQ